MSQLNAEQHCSARTYELCLPLRYLVDDDSVVDSGDGDRPDATARAFKEVLRALCSPKSATQGSYRHRATNVQKAWRESQRWHNFASSPAVPTDAAVTHAVDRFWVSGEWSLCLGSRGGSRGEPFVRLRVSGVGILDGQVRRLVGAAVCIFRGYLPRRFASLATDPTVIIDVPAVPKGLDCLREARYDWQAAKQPILRRRRRPPPVASRLSHHEGALLREIASSPAASDETRIAWLRGMREDTCPRILRAMAALPQPHVEAEGPATPAARACIGDSSSVHRAVDTACPAAYAEVLQLLREADASGEWPTTSRARSRVLTVAEGAHGGSFSAAAPGSAPIGQAKGLSPMRERPGDAPRGNQRFGQLVAAVFALEREIAPHRPPSSMVAINRRAIFKPHTDAGAGAGQSSSLIVGLGGYGGGDLLVEGVPVDIRYRPLEFDGWRERHWTAPFVGERFSLVWFTPKRAAAEPCADSRYQVQPRDPTLSE